MHRTLFIWIICLNLLHVHAQNSGIKLQIKAVDSAAANFKFRTNFASKEQLGRYIQDLPQELIGKGYISASVDSMVVDSVSAFISVYLGPRYRWGIVEVAPEYLPIIQDLKLRHQSKSKKIYYSPADDYREILLDYFEDNGYPFASVGYDSLRIEGETLHGKLDIEKDIFYKIDSISQMGSLRLNPGFLSRYLNIPPGAPFQKSKLERVDQRLDELPFAEQEQPWQLNMLGTGAVVNVFLRQKRSNVLNVLLGVMPASTQTPGNKLLITGDANILLRNSFRVGETLAVNWQQIQYQSPRLNMLYMQPYLFGSKAGVDFYFDLFKKDTQFVNLQVRVGMPYEFSLNRSGKILFLYQQTNVTSVDTAFVIQSGKLPDLAATSATSLGMDYAINNTNYRLNPKRGSEVNLSFLGGTKKVNPNAEIINLKNPSNPDFNYGSLYDSIRLNTYQLRIKAQAAKYFPLSRQTVLKVAGYGGIYQSGNYFRNELFQIGGYRLLRGFDEESIYAQQYAVFTTEYRLLSGKNSYFFGFADAGYAAYKDQSLDFAHGYFGAGLGMVLETRNSLINLSWAIGKRDDLPLDLRQSKIHLGLINFF